MNTKSLLLTCLESGAFDMVAGVLHPKTSILTSYQNTILGKFIAKAVLVKR